MKYGGACRKNVQDPEKKFGMVHHCLICHHRVPNGCAQPVLRVKRSHGGRYMTGGAGIDMVSLAQSRWVGTGVEYGGTELSQRQGL